MNNVAVPLISKHWLLWFGTRIICVFIAVGQPSVLWQKYYAPFISSFAANPSLDPWTNWVSNSGAPEAFPYGWTLLVALTPVVVLGEWLIGSSWAAFLIMAISSDAIALFMLSRQRRDATNSFLIGGYALSPVPVLIVFGLGSTDFVPMSLLAGALLLTRAKKFMTAGILLGLAVGAKFILVIAVFAFLLYMWRASGLLARDRQRFSAGLLLGVIASANPVLYSYGYQLSLSESQEATGALEWGISSPAGTFLILPLIVLLCWLFTYQLRRMNIELLTLTFSAPLMLIAALPGAPLGWALWSLPIVLALSGQLSRRIKVLVWTSLNFPIVLQVIALFDSENSPLLGLVTNAAITTSFLLASTVVYLLWRELVTKSDFVRQHSRPALILIAGDSGVGKDTLAEGLSRTLGEDSCVRISGDDYHRWDRGEGAWNYLTHLNPSTNELSKFFNDLLTLTSGQDITNGHYDHETGKRAASKKSKSREFVIASGLHALHLRDVNLQSSLSIFLDMGENLRTDLKVARDTEVRGHSREAVLASIEKRRADSELFIAPQRNKADLHIKTDYAADDLIKSPDNLEVSFISEPKIFDDQLISELSVTCGLELSVSTAENGRRSVKVIGVPEPASLNSAFERIEPRISKILGSEISWSPGSAGLVQMVTLVYLSNALRRERLI
ncbi:MAG: phosphoribulokinase [Actinomycetota bacterium]